MNTVAKIKPETATPVDIPDIHARMVAVMRELGAIGKDKSNAAQGFKYRGIDDVYNAINPVLAKNGVFMTATVVSKTREERTNAKGTVLAFTCLHMRYQFRAEDGSVIETEAEGEGMDSGDKSSNKAMAVAHKYALLQAFCIPTQDLDDPDAHVHEVAAKGKPAAPPAPDQDQTDGVANWVAKQKAAINACATLPALYGWLDQIAGAEGTISDPDSSSPLDRLKRKATESYGEIVQAFQKRLMEINKKANQ